MKGKDEGLKVGSSDTTEGDTQACEYDPFFLVEQRVVQSRMESFHPDCASFLQEANLALQAFQLCSSLQMAGT